MADSLSSGAAKRAAAKKVTKSTLTGRNSGKKTVLSTSTTTNSGVQTGYTNEGRQGGLIIESTAEVPELQGITPEHLPSLIPVYDHNQYKISDPLKPPENAPQVTDAERERGLTIYNGMGNALDLVEGALGVTDKKLKVLQKYYKVYGTGIQASTEFVKTKSFVDDFKTQVQITGQKNIALQIAEAKTNSALIIGGYTLDELAEKETQAGILAEKARTETSRRQTELDEAKAQIGVLN